ncbi:adenylyltransferase/cytidyltransferase family protein [Candidatus Pacearchaeota archaeon]|nr:adenylyltransferase/cytidyltransferase family protein [Candidatus Pacearchaeota archaeon]
MGKYIPYKKLEKIVDNEKVFGKSVVLTGGCFDIIHKGHLYLFRRAKEYGDILVVNVVNDERVKTYKGEERPVNIESQRASVVSALEIVDYATVHPSVDLGPTTELAIMIKPDVIVQVEGKWKRGDKKRLAGLLGYDVKLREVKKSRFKTSTTSIIDEILKKHKQHEFSN